MWIKNTVLAAAVSTAILGGADKCLAQNIWEIQSGRDSLSTIEQVEPQDSTRLGIEEAVKSQIFVCLETDDSLSYTHTKVMEKITDPRNTVLEYPVEQLFKKYLYENKMTEHPFYVSWLGKNFRALMWEGWIESTDLPQTLNPRAGKVTSATRYEIWDTLRFYMIDPELAEEFPENLSDQLKEEWFETFSDKDSLLINNLQNTLSDWLKEGEEKDDYIYDIVVKGLPWWKAATALYRNWKLFIAAYSSVWIPGHWTRKWQFEIIWDFPYKRSASYGNTPMPLSLKYREFYYLHQWVVTWRPASHGCVRQKWLVMDAIYSSVHNKKHVDVFIDKNLNKSKKPKMHTNQKK